MKKIVVSLAALFLTAAAYSQVLKPVKIDSLVSIAFPVDYSKKDTLGQQVFAGNGLSGYMTVIRQPNKKGNQPLKKEKDLKNVIKSYMNGLQKETDNGSILNVRDTLVGPLEGKAFTLETKDENDGVTIREFLLIYTQDATYTFQYVYPEFRKELVHPEMKAYFSSIKLSRELQSNDQFLSRNNGMSTTLLAGIIGGGIALLVLIIYVMMRRKKSNLPVNG
jgi:hypothetical protein